MSNSRYLIMPYTPFAILKYVLFAFLKIFTPEQAPEVHNHRNKSFSVTFIVTKRRISLRIFPKNGYKNWNQDENPEAYPPASDHSNMKSGNLNRPTFIGIGGHKCASTWLSECLRYHPEIFMSSPKEIHFYSYDSNHDIDWYLDHFKDSEKYKARGEFSATYLQYPGVAAHIFDTIGKVKIIVSLRNPVDRFISHYKHLYRLGHVKFEKLDKKNFTEIVDEHPELLQRGNYSRYIKEFMNIFGREHMLILLKEDIDNHPHETLQKLYGFLGTNPDFIPPIFNKKVSPGIIPKIYLLEYFRVNMYRMLKNVSPSLINLIRKARVAEWYRKLNSKKNASGITKDVKEELEAYYEKDVNDLEPILNRSLADWKIHASADKELEKSPLEKR